MNNKELSKMFPELEKKYKGNLTLTVASESPKIEIIGSTGSFLLDSALECGGIPSGRIVEYYGSSSGGKTSLSLITAGEIQKRGGVAAYLDIENSFNKYGVDSTDLSTAEDYVKPLIKLFENR